MVLALLGSSLVACSAGSTAEATGTPAAVTTVDESAFPVTIEHAHGSTTIASEPKRVVTIGWSEHDFTFAPMVVPMGRTHRKEAR